MKEKILIVEDDLEIARILKEHLTRRGYVVNWSSTGKEGLEDFKKDNYELVIVDIMLPEMDGFTLCKAIRMESDVPLLITSAKKSDEDKVKGLKLGADDYITKPFSLVEFEARIESHLRRYRRFNNGDDKNKLIHTSKKVFNEELIIDEDKKLVMMNKEEICLTAKEYEILILMANNPNKVFSKRELYEYVWGQNDVDGNNTITVHIKQLRNKLMDKTKNPKFIQTVWGIGYKFIGEQTL
ncbi:response regulator transcription factor [Haloimpatiens sp. FM7330]|uniref:response regulator transcription factor n=1 Tax=Haloimpatiens sp. FM7330 TaxID=3298610 RepID=UPI0036437929